MKFIPLAAVCIGLSACAVAPQTARETSAPPVSSPVIHQAEQIEVAAVVDLEARSETAPEEACRRTLVTGTRISRVQCASDVPESQRILDDELVRSEIEYAREMAVIEEQRQADQAAEAALRQMQTGGFR